MNRHDEIRLRLDEAKQALQRAYALLELPEDESFHETAAEFAERRRVSVFTVRRWVAKGMPHAKPAGKISVPVAAAERWLDSDGRIVDIQQNARRRAWAKGTAR